MARLIVKQPNGLFAMWSTVSDEFEHTDLTQEQYINIRAEEVAQSTRDELERAFKKGDGGSVMDYEECMEMLEERERDEEDDEEESDE